MRNEPVEKVKRYILENRLIEHGDTVVTGVSGGADSVCLLCVLHALRRELSFSLVAVHVNHGLRPSAGEEEAYVKKLCRDMDIPVYTVTADVKGLAAKEGISTEEAGRILRYSAFEEHLLPVSEGKRKIAVAHHMDDNAETILFHLFRGSGMKGLRGMRPKRDYVIRPLLCLRRQEIEDYLNGQGILFCTDESNEEDDYTRNRIRHHILPAATAMVNEKSVEHMQEAATQIALAENYLEEETKKALAMCLTERENGYLITEKEYRKLHPYLQSRVIMKGMEFACRKAKDLSGVHVRDVEKLFDLQCGRGVDLPEGVRAEREYEGVFLGKANAAGKKTAAESPGESYAEIDWNEVREKGGAVSIPLSDSETVRMKIFAESEGRDFADFPKEQYTKWMDCDTIKGNVCFRKRREGDYFFLDENGNRKKLKAYFVDEKIPQKERDALWVMARGSHVLWIVGCRLCASVKITEKTKTVVQVEYIGGKEDGKCN